MSQPAQGLQVSFAPRDNQLVTVHGALENDQVAVVDNTAFTDLVPPVTDAFDTGKSDKRWQSGYFGTGGVTIDGTLLGTDLTTDGDDVIGDGPEDLHEISGDLEVGANIFVNESTNLAVPAYTGQGDLIPSKNSTYDLGSPALRWRHGYFNDYTSLRRHINRGDWTVDGAGLGRFGDSLTDTHTFNGAVTAGNMGPIGGSITVAQDLTLNGTGINLAGGLSSGGSMTVTGNTSISGDSTWGSTANNVHTITGDVHFTGPVTTTGNITGYTGGSGTYSSGSYMNIVDRTTRYPPELGTDAAYAQGHYVKVGSHVTLQFRIVFKNITQSIDDRHVNFDVRLPFPRVGTSPDEDYTTGFLVMRSITIPNFIYAKWQGMKNSLTPNNREFQSPIIGDGTSYAAPTTDYCRFTGDGLRFMYEDGNSKYEEVDFIVFYGWLSYIAA